MALEQKLSLKLAQKLVMTPSLQQAIKLLQMTRLELEGVLNQELVENPILEEREPGSDEDGGGTEEAASESEASEVDEAFSDIDIEAYFGDLNDSWEGSARGTLFEEREGPPLENTLTREADLYDQLLWQLHMLDLSARQREIAECIIGNLDPDGFLVASVDEIRAMGAEALVSEEAALGIADEAETVSEQDSGSPMVADEAEPQSSVVAQEASPEDDAIGGGWDSLITAAAAPANETSSGSGGAETVTPPETEGSPEAMGEETPDPALLEALLDEPEIDPELIARGYGEAEVLQALETVRSLEPPGVACWTLQESLLRQLDSRGEPEDSLARRLVEEKWDAMTHRKFEAIAREFGISLAKLKPAVELIASLDTRPGRRFDTERTHYVEPDVYVVKVGDEYVIQLNDNGLPRLRVSRAYRKMLLAMRSRGGSEAEARQYIKEKMRSAVWLIKSLDQRQRTIYKVANSIVEQQRGFLDHGVDHLRPMVLRDVAEDIGMHESTVSRVVSNKYIHTPRGLLPMKFFFHSGIDREYGGDISSLTVKRKIKSYIQDEDSKKPLSDSELMRILKREGISIARRTVAKYRDELGIPSSTDRKKIF